MQTQAKIIEFKESLNDNTSESRKKQLVKRFMLRELKANIIT